MSWLLVILLICWSRSPVVAANETKDTNPPIPDEVIQMIQPDATINVGIVVDQHTESGKTQITTKSYNSDIEDKQKAALASLLKNSKNFTQNGVKVITVYHIVTISHKSEFATINIGKEGIGVWKGNNMLIQRAFSSSGLKEFEAWAADAAKNPYPHSRSFDSMPPMLLQSPVIRLSPTDRLMNILLNQTGN